MDKRQPLHAFPIPSFEAYSILLLTEIIVERSNNQQQLWVHDKKQFHYRKFCIGGKISFFPFSLTFWLVMSNVGLMVHVKLEISIRPQIQALETPKKDEHISLFLWLLSPFGHFWALLNTFEQFWALLGTFELFGSAVPGVSRPFSNRAWTK